MAAIAAVVAVWALLAVPVVPPLPRARQTVVDLARRLTDPAFLHPTAALPRRPPGCRSASGSCPSRAPPRTSPRGHGRRPYPSSRPARALVQPRAGRALDDAA